MTEEETRPTSKAAEVISFIKTVVFLVVLAIILRATVVEAYKIPSGSMKPTLKIGDHILVNKLSYGFRIPFRKQMIFQFNAPDRKDIVVFTRPDEPHTLDDESAVNIIKRVVGLPGDTVEVRNRRVYINGEVLDESYSRWAQGGNPEGEFGPLEVPEGHVFLLGDNRDHSRDSRFWHKPFLDQKLIKGRALIIYWSWDSFGRIGTVLR